MTIGGISLATFLTRAALHLTTADVRLSPQIEAALRYAPACALAAIIVPDLVVRDGAVVFSLANARLIGGCVSIVVFLATRSVIVTIAGGMAAFWLVRVLVGSSAPVG
jgi:branched-subunit amino acid transport protein